MIAAALCLTWVAVTASVAAWATLRSRRSGSEAPAIVPVLVLRPCAGDEPSLERALFSSDVAPRGSRLRFLVESESDPARAAAERARATLAARGRDVRVVVTGARAANRKTDQLARALSAEPDAPEIVVVADSDVRLSTQVLADLVGPLARRDAVAVWAPPVEVEPRTAADRASQAVLAGSLQAFALLSALDPRGMVGKLFAIRRDALAQAGGFDSLVSYLGEDMELARRLRALGLPVRVTATPAHSLARGRSWSGIARRYARWIAVLRSQRPALLVTYPLLVASAPLQLLLACVAAVTDPVAGGVAMASVLAVRWSIAFAACRRSRGSVEGPVVGPWLADVTLLVALGLALSSRVVHWRGTSLRIQRRSVVADGGR